MRSSIVILFLCWPLLTAGAVPAPQGRWAGAVEIPGKPLPIVVDLAQQTEGTWAGSIIIPGMGIKGATLARIIVNGDAISFDSGDALRDSVYGPATFEAQLTTGDRLSGRMRQGGNVASFTLARVAPAHVEPPLRSTVVGNDMARQWVGEFELGGYPRHVTITLENHPGAAATATFVVVGKKRTELPVDLVTQEDTLLRIESSAAGIAFEGRRVGGRDEIRGVVEMGAVELPMVLRVSPGRAL